MLIALAILTLSIATLASLYGGALTLVSTSNERTIARLRLQSLLDETGVSLPLSVSRQEGAYEDGATWGMSIERIRTAGGPGGLAAYRVTAETAWRARGGERVLSVSTVKLGVRESNMNEDARDLKNEAAE